MTPRDQAATLEMAESVPRRTANCSQQVVREALTD